MLCGHVFRSQYTGANSQYIGTRNAKKEGRGCKCAHYTQRCSYLSIVQLLLCAHVGLLTHAVWNLLQRFLIYISTFSYIDIEYSEPFMSIN